MKVLYIIQIILFIISFIFVLYLLVFAYKSMNIYQKTYKRSKELTKFLILIPAYKEDKIISDTVKSFLAQNYDSSMYDLAVISDSMEEETNTLLGSFPIMLIETPNPLLTKANAINFALDFIDNDKSYDAIVILDADNIVDKTFLQDISDAMMEGSIAIQAHRVSKNNGSSVAILDTISEEINNSIFRLGHIQCGLSCALAGSGMAFNYEWFCANFKNIKSAGEDKELELMLLEQEIFIDYLPHTFVYDEKVSNSKAFYNQRRRWMAAQLGGLKLGFPKIKGAISNGNFDLIDKVFQWIMPPRVLLFGGILLLCIITSIVSISLSIKWWLLLILLLFAFAFAVPDELIDENAKKAIKKVPLLALMMFINMFRLRGVNKKFIHTKKEV